MNYVKVILQVLLSRFIVFTQSVWGQSFLYIEIFCWKFRETNVYLVFTKYFQNVLFICAQAIASRYLNSRNFFRQITQATCKYYTFLKTLGFFLKEILLYYYLAGSIMYYDKWKIKRILENKKFLSEYILTIL